MPFDEEDEVAFTGLLQVDNDFLVARFRLIDMASGEIGIVTDDRESISDGETIAMPDGRGVEVLEVYDDEEHGQEGGVAATLAVDDGSVPEEFTRARDQGRAV